MKTCYVLRLAFLFMLAAGTAGAQTLKLDWMKTIETSSTLTMSPPLTDRAGNLYISHKFSGTIDLDPGPGAYMISDTNGHTLIAKFDTLGNLLWGRAMGINIACWTLDEDGTIWYISNFQGTVDFDPGPGTYELTSTNHSKCLGSITTDGSFNSALDIKLPTGLRAFAIFAAPFSQIYVAGGFSGSVDFDPDVSSRILTSAGSADIFVASYTAGGLVDAFSIGGPGSDIAYTIAQNGNKYLIGGTFSESVDFAPGPDTAFLHGSAKGSGFIAEYDFAGRTVNTYALGAGVSSAVAGAAPGSYTIVGRIGDSTDVDPGPGRSMFYQVNPSDIFIVRMTPASSSISYAKAVRIDGTYYSQSIATSKMDGLIVSGYKTAAMMDFNGGAASGMLAQVGAPDGFISKFDASGTHKYVVPVAGTGAATVAAVVAAPDGAIYIAGSSTAAVDLELGTGVRMTSGPGAFFARYLDYEVLSVPGQNSAAIEVYNANRVAYVDFSACAAVRATIRITAMDGRTILETTHQQADMRRIDLGDAAAGLYILTVQNGSDRISRKISVQ